MRFADCDARAMDAPGSLNIDAVRRTTPGFAPPRRRDAEKDTRSMRRRWSAVAHRRPPQRGRRTGTGTKIARPWRRKRGERNTPARVLTKLSGDSPPAERWPAKRNRPISTPARRHVTARRSANGRHLSSWNIRFLHFRFNYTHPIAVIVIDEPIAEILGELTNNNGRNGSF